jgi:hypothetical protein
MQKTQHSATLDSLVQDTLMQSEVVWRGLAIEWGQMLFSRLLERWGRIEAHENIAYEDKLAAQVRTLEEARTSLWHLHKDLSRRCRKLKAHQKRLKRLMDH